MRIAIRIGYCLGLLCSTLFTSSAFALAISSTCNDNAPTLAISTSTPVTYSQIQSLISLSGKYGCAGCHTGPTNHSSGSGALPAGQDLTQPGDGWGAAQPNTIYTSWVNVSSLEYTAQFGSTEMRVEPFSSTTSWIYEKLNCANPRGIYTGNYGPPTHQMPDLGTYMTLAANLGDLQMVRDWINQGANSFYTITSPAGAINVAADGSTTITIQIKDMLGNAYAPNPARTITWSSSNGGSFSAPTSTTNGSGAASVTFFPNTTAGQTQKVTGTDIVQASGPAFTLAATSATITTVAGAANKYVVTPSINSNITAFTTVSLTAQLEDLYGNDVSLSQAVVWSDTMGSGGSFTAQTNTNGSGVATATFKVSKVAGVVHQIQAATGGETGKSGQFTVIADVAAQYKVTPSANSNVTAFTPVSLTAQLEDQYGNNVSVSQAVVWSDTMGSGGSFTAQTNTNGSGVATATFKVSKVAGVVHQIQAATGGETGQSGQFTVIADVANATTFNVTCPAGTAAGTAVTVNAQLVDEYGNNAVPVSPITVTWTNDTPGNGAHFAPLSSNTGSGGPGIATAQFTTSTLAGVTHTLSGSNPSTTPVYTFTSATVLTDAGTDTQYVVTANGSLNPLSTIAGNTVNLSAQLADINGNPVPTPSPRTITWTSSNGGTFLPGGLPSATSTTDTNGVATIVYTTNFAANQNAKVEANDISNSRLGFSPVISTLVGLPASYIVTSASSPPAGLATTISAQLVDAHNNNVPTPGPGNTVTWTSNNGGTFAAPGTSNTNATGLATIAFTPSQTSGMSYQITANDTVSQGTCVTFTTIGGAPAQYQLSLSQFNPIAGDVIVVFAQLQDQFANNLTNSGVPLTWVSNNGGSFSGQQNTNTSGIARVNFTTNTQVGTATVTGTDDGSVSGGTKLSGASPLISMVPGAPTQFLVSSTSSNPVAGTAVTITARLADANNNFVSASGKVVTWSGGGSGSFQPTTSTTLGNGAATTGYTTFTTVAAVNIVATDIPDNYTGTAPTITSVPGPPSKYMVTSTNNAPVVATNVTLTATLQDVNANTISTSGLVVTWTSSNGGTFAAPGTSKTVAGVTSITYTANNLVGSATLTATDTTPTAGSTTLVPVPAAAAKYSVTPASNPVIAGTSVTIGAQLQDTFGNDVSTIGNIITWSSNNGGSFGTNTSTTDINGLATVTYTTTTVVETVKITATDTTPLTGTTPAINVVVGVPAKYFVTTSSVSPVAGAAVTISAQMEDSNNNPIGSAGVAVSFSSNNGGSITNVSATNNSGIATATFTTSIQVGNVQITAADSTFVNGISPQITTVSGNAAIYIITTSSLNPIAGSGVTVTAQLADLNGNAVATGGLVETWSFTGSGGSVTPLSSSTNSSGAAIVTFITATQAGSIATVTARDNNNMSGTSESIKTVAGPPAKFLMSTSASAVTAGSTVTISAQLADINNNVLSIARDQVNWNKSGTGGFFNAGTSLTSASGIATITLNTSTIAGIVHTVTAVDAGGSTGTTGSIFTIPGAPAQYLVSVDNASPVAGTVIAATAQLEDSNGNPVLTSGVNVIWSAGGVGGTFSANSSNTNSNGVASINFTTAASKGVATITATSPGPVTGTSGNVISVAGTPTQYFLTVSNSSPPAGSAVVVAAQLVDANGNTAPVAGNILTWSTTGSGSVASPTSSTDGNGLATVQFTTANVASSNTIQGTDGAGLTSNVVTIASPLDTGAPVMTSALTAAATVGTPFTYVIASNGAGPFTLAASPLPDGLSLSGNTIVGTPTGSGTFTINVSVANSLGADNEVLVLQLFGNSTATSAIGSDGGFSTLDSNGNGVPDFIEALAVTDPNNPAVKPIKAGILEVDSAQFTLNFFTSPRDSIKAVLRLTLPAGYAYEGSTCGVQFAGAVKKGIPVGQKGGGGDKNLRIIVQPVVTGSQIVLIRYFIRNQNLLAGLAPVGFINATVAAAPLTVPAAVVIQSNGKTYYYIGSAPVVYKAKQGAFGRAH